MLDSILKYMTGRKMPTHSADKVIVNTPEMSRGGGRVYTEVYGTAPFMAGRGAPAHLIMDEDRLRAQTTTSYDKAYTERPYDTLPFIDLPVKARQSVPLSTRGMRFEP